MSGFRFTVIEEGEIVFQQVYDVELLSEAMELFICDRGGLELGETLEITEIE